MNERPNEGLSDEEKKTAETLTASELETQADTARDQGQYLLAAELYTLACDKETSAIKRGQYRTAALTCQTNHNPHLPPA